MESITHILDSINTFSTNNFIFSQYIEVFKLLKSIPDSISSKLNHEDFLYHLNHANTHLSWLNEYFDKTINPLLRKELNLFKSSKQDPITPYADFTVDKPPIFEAEKPIQLSFEDISRNALEDGRPLKPVRRTSDDTFTFKGTCPFCGAPHEYIYDNNKKGQLKCKACKNTFTVKTTLSEEASVYCPYCKKKLSPHHDRKGYIVYVCPNKKCSYYKENKRLFNEGKADHLKTSSKQYRFKYHYRDFKFNLDSLNSASSIAKTKVNLAKIHFSSSILGLALTYYINYGLSARKTALILKQVHGIRISHQTIANYAASVSTLIKPLVDKYPYKLSNTLTGDETYIKVRGKNKYVFFFSDPFTKIITSNPIFDNRDTECACKAILQSLNHYPSIPDDLRIITDGNPIYNATQIFFSLHGIHFDLHQVIGVKNKDEISKKYRPFKQIEERLNRTYKQNSYYGTNGYDNLESANNHTVLFTAFFNFLRQHSALGYKTPVDDGLFPEDMLMQDKWLKLIEYSYQYH